MVSKSSILLSLTTDRKSHRLKSLWIRSRSLKESTRTAHTTVEAAFKGKQLSCPGCGCLEELTQPGMLLGWYRATTDSKGIPGFRKVASQFFSHNVLRRGREQHIVENPSASAQPKSRGQVMALLPSKVCSAFTS